jgi:hypothetical protein
MSFLLSLSDPAGKHEPAFGSQQLPEALMSDDNIKTTANPTAIGSRNHADFMPHDHDDRCGAQSCVELPTPVT